MKFCPNCGTQLKDEAVFCNECGSKVAPPGVAPAPAQPQYQAPPEYQQPAQPQYQAPPEYQQPVQQNAYQQPAEVPYQAPPVIQQTVVVVDDQSGLKTAAKVFMILGCISFGWTLIGLAWSIPMTVTVFHRFRDNEPVGTGLKVCTLLFLNVIAGILLLCVKNPQPQQPQY